MTERETETEEQRAERIRREFARGGDRPDPRREADVADVKRLLAIDRGLSAREVAFAESLGRQVIEGGRPISEPQRRWLNDILTRFKQ